jgi:hypothetical protein
MRTVDRLTEVWTRYLAVTKLSIHFVLRTCVTTHVCGGGRGVFKNTCVVHTHTRSGVLSDTEWCNGTPNPVHGHPVCPQVGLYMCSLFQSTLCATAGLQAAQSGVWLPAGPMDSCLQSVQAGCGTLPASYSVDTGHFSGAKADWFHLVPRLMNGAVPLLALYVFMTTLLSPHRHQSGFSVD